MFRGGGLGMVICLAKNSEMGKAVRGWQHLLCAQFENTEVLA